MSARHRRERYKLYLKSPHWIAFRRRYFEKHPKECRECKATARIELHHLTYERLGGERLDDVVPLCHSCHKGTHEALKISRPAPKRKRDRQGKGFSKKKKRRAAKVVVTYADGTREVKKQHEFQARRKPRTPPVKKGVKL